MLYHHQFSVFYLSPFSKDCFFFIFSHFGLDEPQIISLDFGRFRFFFFSGCFCLFTFVQTRAHFSIFTDLLFKFSVCRQWKKCFIFFFWLTWKMTRRECEDKLVETKSEPESDRDRKWKNFFFAFKTKKQMRRQCLIPQNHFAIQKRREKNAKENQKKKTKHIEQNQMLIARRFFVRFIWWINNVHAWMPQHWLAASNNDNARNCDWIQWFGDTGT